MTDRIRWLRTVSMNDVGEVGGKNASLGEMLSKLSDLGVTVPDGFATTASAFRSYLTETELDERINNRLADLDVDDVGALGAAGEDIRRWITSAPLPDELASDIHSAYGEMGADVPVAVRSSATAEDLPDASFAGQQETFLNVRGSENVVRRVLEVFASLYNDRAIAYRVHHGYSAGDVAISAGVQRMVNSVSSGVAFTVDTESGFSDVVFITSAFGLGELLVQGVVNPDEFYVHKQNLRDGRAAILSRSLGLKQQRMTFAADDSDEDVVTEEVPDETRRSFSLSDSEVEELAQYALTLEDHYGRPMDIEWGKDADDGRIYILQARPETVQSQDSGKTLERFSMDGSGEIVTRGRAVGQKIGTGVVRVVQSVREMDQVQEGDVLVAGMTDPDWEPVMRRSAAIVTDRGGRTCHAAIIARELGIPAVVGTGDATSILTSGETVTVSCAEGDEGRIYRGEIPFRRREIKLDAMPEPPTKIMMNVASPAQAFSLSRIPNHGVGLARVEFVINNMIGIHPRALLEHDTLPAELAAEIKERTAGYADPPSFFVEKLTEGIAMLAAAFDPKPVIVRLSDFKTNEYSHLLGGERYEPSEENPMIGFRGAARYRDPEFADAFALECRSIRQVREEMGFRNVEVMVPFVRTLGEAEEVVDILQKNGLERGKDDLRLVMMCEIPSNAIMARDFLEFFDGFSIGSNDLTQLTLALDRDSGLVASLFDERDPAVKELIRMATDACHEAGKYIGICGQGPSDHPDLAQWLVDIGLDSMSLNPDTVLETWLQLSGKAAT